MKKMDSYSFDSSFAMNIKFKDKEVGFLNNKMKENIVAMINEGSPKVLGIDNESEVNTSNPLPLLTSFPKEIEVVYKIKGKVDKKDAKNIKSNSNIQINFDLGGTNFEINADVIILENILYFKFNKIPVFAEQVLRGMDVDLGSGWWKINGSETEKLANNGIFGLKIDSSEKNENDKKSKEIKEKISEIFKNRQIIKFNERLRDVKFEGENHYHYKSGLDIQNLTVALKEFAEITYSEFAFKDMSKDEQKAKTEEATKNLSKIFTKSDIELWINKKSFNMRKSIYDFALDMSKSYSDKGIIAFGAPEINIKGSVEYVDINKAVNINAPENSNDIVVLISEKLQNAKIKARDTKRLADTKQIQTALELYYSDNNRYPEEIGSLFQAAFMFELPKDPKPNNECGEEFDYFYMVKDSGQDFDLNFCLEQEIGKYQKGINLFNSMVSSSTRAENMKADDSVSGAMLDSDNDGLNDFEEEMIYYTNVSNPDTDGDGYSDGSEVQNGYNPLGDGKLDEGCREKEDCEKYISYNTCEVMCIQRNSDKNTLNQDVLCDPTLWEPPTEVDCDCVNKKCILF
jgi:hypothetical protein